MQSTKRKTIDILDLANQLRSDADIDWSGIVADADWIGSEYDGGVDWTRAWNDLSTRLPRRVLESLGWSNSISESQNWWMPSTIAAAERAIGKPLDAPHTADELKTALNAISGILAPNLLFSLWRHRRLNRGKLRVVLLDVWRNTDHTSAWPSRTWRAMFRCAGFLSDGEPRPRRSLTVYRGCEPKGRRGFSWTLWRETAEYFADYWFKNGSATKRGHVYKARVRPQDVLAIVPSAKTTTPEGKIVDFRPEREVVVDARFIPIVLVETARKRVAREAMEEARLEARFAQWKAVEKPIASNKSPEREGETTSA